MNLIKKLKGKKTCIPRALNLLDQGIGKKAPQENQGFSIEMFESDILPALRYAERICVSLNNLINQLGQNPELYQVVDVDNCGKLKKLIATIEAALKPPDQK